jgi:hypothetical protein
MAADATRTTAGSPSAALARAILGNVLILERICSSEYVYSTDLCSVARVCRLWRDVALSEKVWRVLWLRHMPSLRSLEATVALPAGPGFRASMRQLFESGRAGRKQWELQDFTLAVDVDWSERPLLSGLQQLSATVLSVRTAKSDAATTVCIGNSLRSNAHAERFFRAARQLTAGGAAHAVEGGLYLNMVLLRSDGAVATIAYGACDEVDVALAVGAPAAERHIALTWRYNLKDQPESSAFYSPELGLAHLCWELRLEWRDDGRPFDGFHFALLRLTTKGAADIQTDDLVRALNHTSRWTLPRTPHVASAKLHSVLQAAAAAHGAGGSTDATARTDSEGSERVHAAVDAPAHAAGL